MSSPSICCEWKTNDDRDLWLEMATVGDVLVAVVVGGGWQIGAAANRHGQTGRLIN